MKRALLLFLVLCGISTYTYSQKGDLYVGAKGGYITSYKDIVYGVRAGYHLTDQSELNFTYLMNPDIKMEDDNNSLNNSKLSLYSFNLDFHYYIIMNRMWSMGPLLGGQYGIIKDDFYNNPLEDSDETKYWALNVGWHIRFNIGENVKLNGGWRYAAATEDMGHHMFYLGLGYTFSLY